VELPNNILVVLKSFIDFPNSETTLISRVELLGIIHHFWLDVEVFVHWFHVQLCLLVLLIVRTVQIVRLSSILPLDGLNEGETPRRLLRNQ
jgi:hypothetical protein